MTRVFYALLTAIALSSSTGCGAMDRFFCHHWGCGPWGGCASDGCEPCGTHGPIGDSCSSCGIKGKLLNGGCTSCGHGLGHHHHKYDHFPRGAGGTQVGPAGPPTAAVTYPYYTTRGPRDFLDPNPPSIGP